MLLNVSNENKLMEKLHPKIALIFEKQTDISFLEFIDLVE